MTSAVIDAEPTGQPAETAVEAATVEAALIDPVLTVDEAAAHLKLSGQTVRTLQRNGVIESFRVGKSIRFRLSRINEWIARQELAEQERIASESGRPADEQLIG